MSLSCHFFRSSLAACSGKDIRCWSDGLACYATVGGVKLFCWINSTVRMGDGEMAGMHRIVAFSRSRALERYITRIARASTYFLRCVAVIAYHLAADSRILVGASFLNFGINSLRNVCSSAHNQFSFSDYFRSSDGSNVH